MRSSLFATGGVAVGLAAALLLIGNSPTPASTTTTTAMAVATELDPAVTVHERAVEVDRDDLDGYLAYAPFTHPARTRGPAADVIKVFWDQPVDVYGVSISVDIDYRIPLVEYSIGRNWENYTGNTTGSLLHVSAVDPHGDGSVIDERVWFDIPFTIDEGEWLAVTAWITNSHDTELVVHPEVTFWYRPQ